MPFLDGFTLVAGPCVLEDHALNLEVGAGVREAAREAGIPAVFKASFDKANRSRLHSHRGPGLRRGLDLLAAVRDDTGLPVLTDIHEPGQAGPVAEVGGCAADPRVPVPADLAAPRGGRGGGGGGRGEHQEGAVDVPRVDGRRGREGPGRRGPRR